MIDMNEAVQRLCLHEGIRLQPYKCPAGYWTIGVGRNLETNPPTAEEKRVIGDWRNGITKNAAFYLLRNDIKRISDECARQIPFWKNLDDERQYALVDMAFNLGMAGLLKFQKMLSYLGVGNYIQAATECLASKYAKDVGERAVRVAKIIERECGRYDLFNNCIIRVFMANPWWTLERIYPGEQNLVCAVFWYLWLFPFWKQPRKSYYWVHLLLCQLSAVWLGIVYWPVAGGRQA